MESIASLYRAFATRKKGRGASISPLSCLMLLLAAIAPASPTLADEHSQERIPTRLLVLGDSLSAGYGLAHADGFEFRLQAALKARGHEVKIVEGAVSGDTSAGGRARLDWALGDGADVAIVELGANDGLRGVDPKALETNLTAILDALASRHIPVLLAGMYAPPNFGPDYQQAFRAVFDRLGKRPGVLYEPFFLEGVATIPDLNQADHMHPNPDGVRLIVARILPLVEKLLTEVNASGSKS